MRIRQGVVHDRLQDGSGKSQVDAYENAGNRPGQANIPNNLIRRRRLRHYERLCNPFEHNIGRAKRDGEDEEAESRTRKEKKHPPLTPPYRRNYHKPLSG